MSEICHTSARATFRPSHIHKDAAVFYCGVFSFSIELLAILAGSLRFLAALNAGALVVLALTHLGQYTGLGTAALKTLERALQRLVFSHTDFRHLYFPPSGAAGDTRPRKGHLYGFNSNIIFAGALAVKWEM